MATDHLWRRGNQWYLRVAIPRPHRHLFLSKTGKPLVRVVERLSDSKSVAKVMAADRVAVCMRVFAKIKAGLLTTPEQVKEALYPSEFDVALQPGFDEAMRRYLADPEARRAEFERRGRAELERRARWFEWYGASGEQPASTAGETVSQAAEAWYAELTRDKAAAPRDATLDGHRLRVRAFVGKVGDVPLIDVTRAAASDFLAGLDVSNRTRNGYATTLRSVFECARRRGRFTGDNPFDGMKAKVAGSSYQPFTVADLQTLFDALPRQRKPAKHSPDTALPWCAAIALYTGARLEEIAQLTTADFREEAANGARVWCIDIHNGSRTS
jgi:hypothetical protein